MTASKISCGSIRGLGGERLTTASYALRPNMNFFCLIMKRDQDFLFVRFLHTNGRFTFDLDTESTHTVTSLLVRQGQ